jgi:hypothetical protein
VATYTQLQTRVQRRVIDLPSSVTAEVPDLINEAIRELQNRHDFQVCEALSGPTSTDAVTPSHTLLAQPSDWSKARGDPYFVRNDGSWGRLTWAPDRAECVKKYGQSTSTSIGRPRLLLLGEASDDDGTRNIEVWPYPDGNSDWTDGEYRVYVPYWKFLPDLSASGDANWFSVNALRWIIAKATSEAFYLNWDENRGTLWEAKAEKGANEAIRLDKLQRLGGVGELVWHKDVQTPRVRT